MNPKEDSRTKHPLGYALSSGFLFGALSWGFLHFPLWFSVASGLVMAVAVWTGYRPNGWARRMAERRKTE